MQKIMIIALLILMALSIMACEEDGELRIRNRTSARVNFTVDEANPQQLESWTNWSRYYSDDRVVQVQYQGDYVFTNTLERSVYKGLVTTIDINANGGAIRLINNGNNAINAVFLSPSSETEWGDDDLMGILEVNGEAQWTLTPGQWDVRVIDSTNTSYYKLGVTVTVDQTLNLPLSTFTKSAVKAKMEGISAEPKTHRSFRTF
ncbi:MAG: hypothetical protein U1B83_05615 [Candidatus Cloacimonadaceae bacterium]|nr:hypothetical protein [Candidatus Cloacimonadaceae bacterium]